MLGRDGTTPQEQVSDPRVPPQGRMELPPVRPWRLANEQKCQDAAEAGTTSNDAIKNALEKPEALEKHVKTVTMRAESTEADFFNTLLDRQEETQKHLNELTAQLCKTRSAQFRTRRAKRRAHAPERTRTTRFDTFETRVRLGRLTHSSSRDILVKPVLPPFGMSGESEEWWFDVRPKDVGKNGRTLF